MSLKDTGVKSKQIAVDAVDFAGSNAHLHGGRA
jgi:hypothetical protein